MSDASPRLDRILETALYVQDMAKARSFYVDLLGCEPMLDSERLLALSVAGESVLLLFQSGATTEPLPTPGGVVPPHGATGPQHLAFAVAADAIEPWITRLEAAGVPIESRVHWPRGGQSIYVRDPDGHSVELLTRGLWTIF